MSIEQAKETFSQYLKDGNSELTVNDWDCKAFREDAFIFIQQSEKRPNAPFLVRNGKVASVNFAFTTTEEVYTKLA